ncbi:MAG: HigA family addiction module antitoxin [Bdellovibrionota bacterium]
MGKKQKLASISPGEILLHEFLIPLGISQNKLGRELDVPVGRINDIVKGRRSITVDTAMRLSRYFKTSAELWLNLQQRYDIDIAEEKLLPKLIKTITPCQIDCKDSPDSGDLS